VQVVLALIGPHDFRHERIGQVVGKTNHKPRVGPAGKWEQSIC
jgi:hypothetical protein